VIIARSRREEEERESMAVLDETFNVTPEFFYPTLDLIIENIRPILLGADEFKLVPVPFSKSVSYQDKETGRWYESYKDVYYDTLRQFDIVLENSGIGQILIEHRRPDLLHVVISPYKKISEKSISNKIDTQSGKIILDRLVNELCRIEPGHTQKPKPKVETKENNQEQVIRYENAIKAWVTRDTLDCEPGGMGAWLKKWESENNNEFISVDVFKEALRRAGKAGYIEKINGRWRRWHNIAT
jgi:hypothetical protein